MKEKYGEITMLDFPQFTKDTFPGVTRMDIRSGLFGDVTDDSMFVPRASSIRRAPSGRKWLDKLVAKTVADGHQGPPHLEQRADQPRLQRRRAGEGRRRRGEEMARRREESRRQVRPHELRPALGPSIRPQAVRDPATGYPKNDDIVPYLNSAIESYKEMADYGGNLGIRVTIENHWGLAANPINIRIILDTVNHPSCEASPDFCNWEYEHMLVSGLKALAPYAHTNVHAKFWDRWTTNDVQRSVRIMLAAGYKGVFALGPEEGPLDGIEGAKYLYKEVLAALFVACAGCVTGRAKALRYARERLFLLRPTSAVDGTSDTDTVSNGQNVRRRRAL